MPEKRASIHTREKSSTRSSPTNHKFGLKVTVSTSRMCNSKCVKNRTNETVYWRRGGGPGGCIACSYRIYEFPILKRSRRASWCESRPWNFGFPGSSVTKFCGVGRKPVERLRSKFSRAIIREYERGIGKSSRIKMDIEHRRSDPLRTFSPCFPLRDSSFISFCASTSASSLLQISVPERATFPQSRSFPFRNFSSSYRVASGGC